MAIWLNKFCHNLIEDIANKKVLQRFQGQLLQTKLSMTKEVCRVRTVILAPEALFALKILQNFYYFTNDNKIM